MATNDEMLMQKEAESREDHLREMDLWRDMLFAAFEVSEEVTDRAFDTALRYADKALAEYRSRFQ
jgi:hypothetical protein